MFLSTNLTTNFTIEILQVILGSNYQSTKITGQIIYCSWTSNNHSFLPPSSFLSSNFQNPRFSTLRNGLLASITSLCAIITCNSNIAENHLLCWKIQIFLITQLSHQQYFPQINIDLFFRILNPMTTFTFTHLNLYPINKHLLREGLKKNEMFHKGTDLCLNFTTKNSTQTKISIPISKFQF